VKRYPASTRREALERRRKVRAEHYGEFIAHDPTHVRADVDGFRPGFVGRHAIRLYGWRSCSASGEIIPATGTHQDVEPMPSTLSDFTSGSRPRTERYAP
jgi:hypothetical protein